MQPVVNETSDASGVSLSFYSVAVTSVFTASLPPMLVSSTSQDEAAAQEGTSSSLRRKIKKNRQQNQDPSGGIMGP